MTREEGMERLEEIRERLEAATDGPWDCRSTGDQNGRRVCTDDPDFGEVLVAEVHGPAIMEGGEWRTPGEHWEQKEDNADLIANAPSDLRALLDVAEAAEAFAGHFGSDGMEMLASDDAWDDFSRLRNTLEALDADTEETP